MYVREMRELVEGVELNQATEENEELAEPDGVEAEAMGQAPEGDNELQESELEVLYKVASDWTSFSKYMSQLYGPEIFSEAYEILAASREHYFSHGGR